MARINISGRVVYSDLTEASGASVQIVEVDSLPGGNSDNILNRTTDLDGRFSGLSSEWQDREGVGLFGIPVPDVFQLRFVVTVGGKTHRGPFVVFRNSSLPIVLPFLPVKAVPKSKRDLVQVILVSSEDYQDGEKALYDFIETSSEGLTRSMLGDSYRRIAFLKGAAATLNGFVSLVDRITRGPVDAVDLIFTTHGSSNRMYFYDGKKSESEVEAALSVIPQNQRKKLRCVFSTACFGATHLDTWLRVGFNEASGARKVYADSAVSYAPFLMAWAAEQTFAQAVSAANSADGLDLADGIARAYYESINKPPLAAQIDSHRERAGAGRSRIYTMP